MSRADTCGEILIANAANVILMLFKKLLACDAKRCYFRIDRSSIVQCFQAITCSPTEKSLHQRSHHTVSSTKACVNWMLTARWNTKLQSAEHMESATLRKNSQQFLPCFPQKHLNKLNRLSVLMMTQSCWNQQTKLSPSISVKRKHCRLQCVLKEKRKFADSGHTSRQTIANVCEQLTCKYWRTRA